jgi:hypothetical protein
MNGFCVLTELFPGTVPHPAPPADALLSLTTTSHRYPSTGRFHAAILARAKGRQRGVGLGSGQDVGWRAWRWQSGKRNDVRQRVSDVH